MTSLEKIAYLKGVIDGLNFEFKGDEGKVLNEMVELLEILSAEVTDLRESLDYTDRELAAVNEDLLRVEDRLYGSSFSDSDDEEDYGEEDDDCEDDCEEDEDHHHHSHPEDYEYFVICPSCDERLGITVEDLERGSIACPKCGEDLEFDIDDECDCGCGHDHHHHDHDHDHGHDHDHDHGHSHD